MKTGQKGIENICYQNSVIFHTQLIQCWFNKSSPEVISNETKSSIDIS